jgi:hypothetical protein
MYIRSDSPRIGGGGGAGRVVVLNGSRTNVQNLGICREIRRRVGEEGRKRSVHASPSAERVEGSG